MLKISRYDGDPDPDFSFSDILEYNIISPDRRWILVQLNRQLDFDLRGKIGYIWYQDICKVKYRFLEEYLEIKMWLIGLFTADGTLNGLPGL